MSVRSIGTRINQDTEPSLKGIEVGVREPALNSEFQEEQLAGGTGLLYESADRILIYTSPYSHCSLPSWSAC